MSLGVKGLTKQLVHTQFCSYQAEKPVLPTFSQYLAIRRPRIFAWKSSTACFCWWTANLRLWRPFWSMCFLHSASAFTCPRVRAFAQAVKHFVSVSVYQKDVALKRKTMHFFNPESQGKFKHLNRLFKNWCFACLCLYLHPAAQLF